MARPLLTGCPFHPRCDYARAGCDQRLPEARRLSDTHVVRCHLYNDTTENKLEVRADG